MLDDVLRPVVNMAIPAVCCAILVIAPGRRRARPARLLWFGLLVVFAIVLPPSLVAGNRFLFGLGYQYAFLAAASALGVLRLAYDPRLALACGLVWATIALAMIYDNTVFGLAPYNITIIQWVSALTLSAALLRLALMRQPQTL